MRSIRDILQHYLINMVHRSNLGSPSVQIVIVVKLPITCDDYLQAYITPQKLNIWTISTLGLPPRTFLLKKMTHLQATNMAAEDKNV